MKVAALLLASPLALALLHFTPVSAGSVEDTPGVTSNTVLLGQACALKGPAAGLGKGMKSGLETYFDKANAAGGAGGRQIKLKSLNDGYEPEKTALATRTLIEKVGAFLMIGGVGTPTSMVAVPVCEENSTPYVGPFTGAEFLRSPFKHWVVNVRASYFQEMEQHAAYLVDQLGYDRVACFYQNDGYGKAGLKGIELALERRGLTLCSTGTYERNTTAVAVGLDSVAQGGPQAVVMVGAYKSCAAFIKAAKNNPRTANAVFGNLSFVGTMNLLEELGGAAEGCTVTQVVPYPWDKSVPAVKEYHQAMKKAKKSDQIGFVTLEGYLVGKFFCQVLDSVEGDLTRESFIQTVDRIGTWDLGGVVLNYSNEDHQGLDNVWMTVFHGGKVEPVQVNLPAGK